MAWKKRSLDFDTSKPPKVISFYFARVDFDMMRKVEDKRIAKRMTKMGVIARMMELFLKDKK
jgi:hypothetical protein